MKSKLVLDPLLYIHEIPVAVHLPRKQAVQAQTAKQFDRKANRCMIQMYIYMI